MLLIQGRVNSDRDNDLAVAQNAIQNRHIVELRYTIDLLIYERQQSQAADCANAVSNRGNTRDNWDALEDIIRQVNSPNANQWADQLDAAINENSPPLDIADCPRFPVIPPIPDELEGEVEDVFGTNPDNTGN